MTYDGFLVFGGNEIANNARTRGYAETAHCPMYWYKGPVCAGIWEAMGETDLYTYANITSAPWYDSVNPESTRFFGVYVIDLEGIENSTRSVSVTEGVGHGGVLGPTRKAVKTVTLKAILVAEGRDALEYGMAWFASVLDPGTCGQHGSGCGTVDLAFFAECPPQRSQVVKGVAQFSPGRTNLALSPQGVNPTIGWDFQPRWAGGGTWAQTETVNLPMDGAAPAGTHIAAFYRKTFTATAPTKPDDFSFAANRQTRLEVSPGDVYTFSFWLRPSWNIGVPATNNFIVVEGTQPTGGTVNNVTISDQPAIPPNVWTRLSATYVVPDGVTYIGAFHNLYSAPDVANWPVVGSTLDATGLLVERADALDTYFDGDTPDVPVVAPPDGDYGPIGTQLATYSWTGTPHASTSAHEAGLVTAVEDPEAYADTVLDLHRFLHDTGAVSGPLVTDVHESAGFFANEVEVTFTSERPWVFKATRPIAIPPSLPVVVQDIPFNLAPYPSAELSSGTVIVQTNYAPNPSLEVDLTDWGAWWNSNIPAHFQSQNRTADISAAGSWAYEARVFGDSGATAANAVASDLTIIQSPIALAGASGSRYSFSIWAGALKIAGGAGSTITGMHAAVHWLDAANALISATNIGTPATGEALNGQVFAAKSLVPPAGAVAARINVTFNFTFNSSASDNSDLRFYADAIAVTVP